MTTVIRDVLGYVCPLAVEQLNTSLSPSDHREGCPGALISPVP